jgi:hypothetical protein
VVPTMAMATAERQEWVVDAMAKHGMSYSEAGFSWRDFEGRTHALFACTHLRV